MTSKLATPTLIRTMAELPELVPIGRLDRIWVFPPRVVGEVESGLLVLSLRPEGEEREEGERREVVTLQYELKSGKGAPPLSREITSRGWAPPERVPQLIAGVVRRLGSEEEEPVSEAIEGDPERFGHFVERISLGAG
jgi:hypothetical protein